MKKQLFKPISLLFTLFAITATAMTSCSDDDAPQLPTIQEGEIPAKNLYITIDGTFIYNREGTAHLSGTIDPNADEQHLQLKCDPMFTIYLEENSQHAYVTDGLDIIKEIPEFDITVKRTGERTFVTGLYEKNGYRISLSGEVSVNYNGETDWRLDFVHEQKYSDTKQQFNKLVGHSFEMGLNSNSVYMNQRPITFGKPDYITRQEINLINDFILEEYRVNSGYSGVKLSFIDNENYEIWFKKTGTNEYVKDGHRHKYLIHNDKVLYFLDESEFIDQMTGYLDFRKNEKSNWYLDYWFIGKSAKIKYDLNSETMWVITRFNYESPSRDESDGETYCTLSLSTEAGAFFRLFTRHDIGQNPLPYDDLIAKFEGIDSGYFYPSVKFKMVD